MSKKEPGTEGIIHSVHRNVNSLDSYTISHMLKNTDVCNYTKAETLKLRPEEHLFVFTTSSLSVINSLQSEPNKKCKEKLFGLRHI